MIYTSLNINQIYGGIRVRSVLRGGVRYRADHFKHLVGVMSDMYKEKQYISVVNIAEDMSLSVPTVYRYLAAIQKDTTVDLKVRRYMKKCYNFK